MTDAATILDELDDPALYEHVPDVPVFDEHDEFDERRYVAGPGGTLVKNPDYGKLLRSFRVPDLEEIARTCNAREAEGNVCPLTRGHTVDDAPEDAQPPIWGYTRTFRVAYSPSLKRHVILTRYCLKKEHAKDAKTYPRSSVELWPGDKFFDPIALIRRTPKRDLGQWTYGRGGKVIRYAMEAPAVDAADPNAAAVADPTQPPDAEALDPAEHDKFCRHADAYVKQNFPALPGMHAKYAAGEAAAAPGAAAPGFPGAGNTAVPGTPAAVPALTPPPAKDPDDDKEPKRMAKEAAEHAAVVRYQREIDELKTRLAGQEKAAKVARYERDLTLLAEHYDLDVAEELKDAEDKDDAAFGRQCERIKTRYQKTPVHGGGMLTVADPSVKPTTAEQRDAAVRYATDKRCDYDTALAYVKGGRNGTP